MSPQRGLLRRAPLAKSFARLEAEPLVRDQLLEIRRRAGSVRRSSPASARASGSITSSPTPSTPCWEPSWRSGSLHPIERSAGCGVYKMEAAATTWPGRASHEGVERPALSEFLSAMERAVSPSTVRPVLRFEPETPAGAGAWRFIVVWALGWAAAWTVEAFGWAEFAADHGPIRVAHPWPSAAACAPGPFPRSERHGARSHPASLAAGHALPCLI
jgi:hypothetical protein